MASGSDDEPYVGCGRGGRGALLRAALEQQTRRPGTEEVPPAPPAHYPGHSSDILAGPNSGTTSGIHLVSPYSNPAPSSTSSVPARGRGLLLGHLMGEASSSSMPLESPKEKLARPGSSGRQSSRDMAPARGRNIVPLRAEQSVFLQMRSSNIQQPQLTTGAAHATAHVGARAELPMAEMSKLNIKEFRGEAGEPVSVEVNYVHIGIKHGMGVFQYHVDFMPAIESKRTRCRVLYSDPVLELLGRTRVFDGTMLYLPHRLQHMEATIQTVLPTDGTPVIVHIKFVKIPPPSQCVQLYNVLFKKVMHCLQLTQIGRNYFDRKGAVLVPQHRLELWPGYVQSVAEYEGGLLLNCDASFRVLRSITAREVLFDVHNSYPQDYMTRALHAIVGAVVMTRYNYRTYRVDDIAWDQNPTSTFLFRDDEMISYVDYYKRTYNIEIQDYDQPLLLHRSRSKKNAPETEEVQLLCLVPELCTMTGLTETMRSDFHVMKDVAAHTRLNPNQRHQFLAKYIQNVKSCAAAVELLNDWGVTLGDCTLKLNGRVLPDEKIKTHVKTQYHQGTGDWGRILSQDKVITPVNLDNWVVIFTRRDVERTRGFVSMMTKVCPSMGIQVRPPLLRELPSDSTDSYLRCIRDVHENGVQVIVIIFPTSRDDRYSAVKRLCCVDKPVPSQVIISNTIGQHFKLRSVTQKVALQINCKLGGELWAVEIPMNNVMVIGVDVYHDVARGRQSVLGFVASMNKNMTRWFSKCSFQDHGQELSDCLKISLLEALVKYYEVNHSRPDRIFIFRDGVGDGQLAHVDGYEIEQLMSSFSSAWPGYNPAVAVVVVQKRVNTRIFAKLNGAELDNPAPGTVVDHTITRPDWCDFFLVSQKVRQGTVSPTHYIVIRNSTGLSPDHMQRLTYKLTHLYYNWPGTVRVPAPCQYAHKLCYLVGDSIHQEPSPLLCDRLFYL